jgi:hypothetical protein
MPSQVRFAQAAYSRSAMKPELMERLEQLSAPYATLPSWSVHPNTIRALVRRYSEQAAFYPLEEISQWIAYQRYGLFLSMATNLSSTRGLRVSRSAQIRALLQRLEKPASVW